MDFGLPRSAPSWQEKQEYATKTLPAIPHEHSRRRKGSSNPELGQYGDRLLAAIRESEEQIRVAKARQKRLKGVWSYRSTISPARPNHRMSKSSQKILQLTGHDTGSQVSLPLLPQNVSQPTGNESDESLYSQHDAPDIPVDRWSSGSTNTFGSGMHMATGNEPSMSPTSGSGSVRELPLMLRASSEAYRHTAQPVIDVNSARQSLLEDRDSVIDAYLYALGDDHNSTSSSPEPHPGELVPVENLMPRPLVLRPQIQPLRAKVPAGFRAGPPYSQGTDHSRPTLLAPIVQPSIRHTELHLDPSNLDRWRNRQEISPSGGQSTNGSLPAAIVPHEHQIGERITGTVRRLASAAHAPIKQRIISNHSRDPYGPDTPLPRKLGFMGFMPSAETMERTKAHLHEIKDKTLAKFDRDERRRAELRKNIEVIGESDQNPGSFFDHS